MKKEDWQVLLVILLLPIIGTIIQGGITILLIIAFPIIVIYAIICMFNDN